MAARKRNASGRFVKGGGGKRRRAAARSAPRKRRRRRRSVARAAPRSARSAPRKRRRYRRNPGLFKNPIGALMAGVQDALAVTAGKAAVRLVPAQLARFGLPSTGPAGIAVQLVTALAMGAVAERTVGKRFAPFVVAGAIQAPLEQVIRDLNIPILSPALAAYPGYPLLPSGGPAVSTRLAAGLAGLGTYYDEGSWQ